MSESLQASVVIPAYNAAAYLPACLKGLLAQELSSEAFEIIVVDDGSSDTTATVADGFASQFTHFQVIRQSNGGPAAARNMGVRHARSPITVFLDSDCVPQAGWLSKLLAAFDKQTIVGVEGKTVAEDAPHSPLDHFVVNETGGVYWTCNIAYRTETLKRIGGFDEAFPWPSGEDIDLAERLLKHGSIVFAPDAQVTHLILKRSLQGHLKAARTFSSMIRLWKKHPGLLIPEGKGFSALLLYQLKHLIYPWLRMIPTVLTQPLIFIQMTIIHWGWVLQTFLGLPGFIAEAKSPLITREPLA